MSRLLQEKEEIKARLLAKDPNCASFLYHGNSNPERLNTIIPHFSRTMHSGEEGEFVFATPSFLNAALYSIKLSEPKGRFDAGLQRMGEFSWHDEPSSSEKSILFAMVGNYRELEYQYNGGHVYGVNPASFRKVAGVGAEQIAMQNITPKFALRVGSPRELMAAGVQLFSIRDEWTAGEIAHNWREIVEKNAEEYAFREIMLPSGMLSWVNKDLDIPIPDGPMRDWV